VSVCRVGPGSPCSIKLPSAGCVSRAPSTGGVIGQGATLNVASSKCLHRIASKPVMAAIVNLGQNRAWNLDEPPVTVVLRRNFAFVVWNSRQMTHFDCSLESLQAICTVAVTEK